ncbi:hypothetical protein [uncultured Oscillibacter sp.]|uniref:hypothetical protein n=1 Tax=uncultured Oscillibacter sp. TaxID=876091 RepID=UPI0026212409|nr:hypothetical protein [uncultured Oscillibacter sp.]
MSVEFEHKVIYCKQFPHQDIDKLLEEQEVSGEKFSSMPRESPEAFRQRIEQSSTYILRADKAQKKEAFINLAKSLSAGYEIDMKIEEYGYFVSVTMYMDCATYTGEVKKMLTELPGSSVGSPRYRPAQALQGQFQPISGQGLFRPATAPP